jgi:hypothetical protein
MMATSTSDVPRSGCIMTRIHGGTRIMSDPMMVQGDLILAWRSAMNEARTTIITILASSLNWNWNPPTTTQRAAEPASPVPVPIRSVSKSRAMLSM